VDSLATTTKLLRRCFARCGTGADSFCQIEGTAAGDDYSQLCFYLFSLAAQRPARARYSNVECIGIIWVTTSVQNVEAQVSTSNGVAARAAHKAGA
jgi:hypothetical protein